MINSCKITTLEPKKAEKSIKCWKIFHIKDGEYCGPFTKYKYSDIREGKHIYPKEG